MNDNDRIFIALSSEKIVAEIGRANKCVAYAGPGINREVAESIVIAKQRSVEIYDVILDANAEVCRIGYGTIDGINLLNQNQIIIRNAAGLRIGLLLCDDRAWIFTPTPLVLEEERRDNRTPNAISISTHEAQNILNVLGINHDDEMTPGKEAEIGQGLVSQRHLEEIKKDIETNPPQKFDIVRKVRVFNALIEYVEVELKGCEIQRRRITLSPELFGITDRTMRERIINTVKLIEENSDLSGDELRRTKNEILKKYTRDLGKPFGRVILRSRREQFQKEIEGLRKKIEEYQKKVRENLQGEIEETKKKLITLLIPIIKEQPPDGLKSQINSPKPSEEQAYRFLEHELSGIIPLADEIIKDMKLEVLFKGVTYETLTNDQFIKAVKQAFPVYDWERPFSEFDAAPAIDDLNN